jgi:uncharacterized LabA/DUF88 family protein
MTVSGLPWPSDPHLRRWMLFVDGENLTIRAQKLAQKNNVSLTEGGYYRKDVFIWLPKLDARISLVDHAPIPIQRNAIRAYYYTSMVGDEVQIASVRRALWDLGFNPEVFKKDKKSTRTKGVDITLAKDFLSNAFLNNYDVAILVAGDGDYVPMVNEVKRQGKVVYVMFFFDNEAGLSPSLRLASDECFKLDDFFLDKWKSFPELIEPQSTHEGK